MRTREPCPAPKSKEPRAAPSDSDSDAGVVVLAADPANPKAPKLSSALEAWARQREALDAGDVTQAEYDAWSAGLE